MFSENIRPERKEYPQRQKIPIKNALLIEKNFEDRVIKPQINQETGQFFFQKTMGNLIFSANNPFQEG